jgi:IclR helix-turn-helix domain
MAGKRLGASTWADPVASTTRENLEGAPVLIELSKAQLDRVVRAASEEGAMSVLLSRLEEVQEHLEAALGQIESRHLSRSLIQGLLLLTCLPADGSYLSISAVAVRSGMTMSTAHRYSSTLLAVGLLDRDPATRQYRLAGWYARGRGEIAGGISQAGSGQQAEQGQGKGEPIGVALSEAQVEQIVQDAAGAGAMSVLLSGRTDLCGPLEDRPAQLDNPRLSRSLLSGLRMLAVFPTDGSYLGNAGLAQKLKMTASTTHRYLGTLVAVGLLERDRQTRRYRLAQPALGLMR